MMLTTPETTLSASVAAPAADGSLLQQSATAAMPARAFGRKDRCTIRLQPSTLPTVGGPADAGPADGANTLLESMKLMLELFVGLLELLVQRLVPPASTPPAGTPPAGTPPTPGTPPTGTPPTGTPPTGTPPSSPTVTLKQKTEQLVTPDAKGLVSEAQMQYAIAAYEITRKSADTARRFEDGYKSYRASGMFIDTAVRRSLADLVTSGALTSEESSRITRVSFRAAQLDTDLERLSGRNGGMNLGTGTAPLADAIRSAESTLTGIANGTITLPT